LVVILAVAVISGIVGLLFLQYSYGEHLRELHKEFDNTLYDPRNAAAFAAYQYYDTARNWCTVGAISLCVVGLVIAFIVSPSIKPFQPSAQRKEGHHEAAQVPPGGQDAQITWVEVTEKTVLAMKKLDRGVRFIPMFCLVGLGTLFYFTWPSLRSGQIVFGIVVMAICLLTCLVLLKASRREPPPYMSKIGTDGVKLYVGRSNGQVTECQLAKVFVGVDALLLDNRYIALSAGREREFFDRNRLEHLILGRIPSDHFLSQGQFYMLALRRMLPGVSHEKSE